MGRSFLVQCRGLPWECTDEQLKAFFGESGIEYVDIPRRGGKATGEAIVCFKTEEDYRAGLKKDREYMGQRYVEVFPMDSARPPRRDSERGPRDRDTRLERGGGGRGYDRDPYPRRSIERDRREGPGPRGGKEGIIRLRGLPFSATVRDIIDFFAPLAIVRDGVLIPDQRQHKTNGEAFVVFEHPDSSTVALQRHMKNIGHRYIEVFEATYNELSNFCNEFRLRMPRLGPSPFVGGVPGGGSGSSGNGPYNGPAFSTPPDSYRSGYPSRGESDPYGSRTPGGPPSDYPSRGSRYEDQYASRNTAPPGGGYYDNPYGPSKPAYDSFPRSNDPYSPSAPQESRFSDYGGSRDPRFDSRDQYEGNWRSSNGPAGGPSSESYNGPNPWGPQGGPPSARADPYGYPNEPYAQREGGGAMRREHAPFSRVDRGYSRSSDPYGYRDREYRGPHFVLRMRGIPFRATEREVMDFFLPVRPDHIELLRDHIGRPSGDARVIFFNRKDYDEALMKDKQYLGHRFIEIIPDTGRY
ncbi:unnamed protein product [Caenorhabditis bovis]|uniref:RRM domain-containing protein n=1 Tax=Caenorhabditis bovis TaxID=2654633 RepID=A0A8S1F6U3_9PELO|nr:unnamed protein product [Caenorhabditis bovis]